VSLQARLRRLEEARQRTAPDDGELLDGVKRLARAVRAQLEAAMANVDDQGEQTMVRDEVRGGSLRARLEAMEATR
jgi:hypothetical protein